MNKVKDTKTFIEKASIIHQSKYDYSKVQWVNNKTKISIICPHHGEFVQSPNNHLSGYGCNTCAKKARSKVQTHTTDLFISKARNIHGSVYDYSLVKYKNSKTPVTIMCENHGPFQMAPSNHTHSSNPQGCPVCGKINNNKNGWTTTEWEAAGKISNCFTGFKLYVIYCWNDTEKFFKIGKTFRSISDRFKNNTTMPYEWKLLHSVEGSAKYISELEIKLHNQYKENKYYPKIPFGGQYECFALEDIQQALKDI